MVYNNWSIIYVFFVGHLQESHAIVLSQRWGGRRFCTEWAPWWYWYCDLIFYEIQLCRVDFDRPMSNWFEERKEFSEIPPHLSILLVQNILHLSTRQPLFCTFNFHFRRTLYDSDYLLFFCQAIYHLQSEAYLSSQHGFHFVIIVSSAVSSRWTSIH